MKSEKEYLDFCNDLKQICIKHNMSIVGAYQMDDTSGVVTCDLGKYGYPWIKEIK